MTEYQTFRLIDPMGETTTTRIEVSEDEETGQKLVFWDDIEDQFPGIQSVRDGDIAVTFARDSKRKRIEPRCIVYRPNAILDVVLLNAGSPVVTLHNSNSIYRSHSTGSTTFLPANGSYTHLAEIFPTIHITSPAAQDPYLANYSNQDLDLVLSPAVADISIASQPSTDMVGTATVLTHSPSSTNWESQVNLDSPSQSPSLSSSTSIIRSSSQFAPKIQSTLQQSAQLFGHFEQSIKLGQLTQAESIKQEIRTHFGDLAAEISKNKELQLQTLELQQTAAEMQQKMLTMQQRALDRLAVIQSRVQALLTTTYELHEYPIPRLFIVLPRPTDTWDRLNPFTHKFRLYFLCECGEHTKSPGSKISHHIHLARHEGYDVDRPTEFFEKYGPYVLIMMEMIRYGVATAGIVVPALANSRLLDGFDSVSEGAGLFFGKDSFGTLVQEAIDYVQRRTLPDVNQAPLMNDSGSLSEASTNGTTATTGGGGGGGGAATTSTTTSTDPNLDLDFAGQVALEGADLRQLASFLKNKDEAKVLGNLYRIVTAEGHVKWVCLDHYRENYREASLQQFKDTVAVNGGTFDQATGKVQVRLTSTIMARQFYDALEQAKFIQELSLFLDWDTSLEDLRMLRDTMVRTNIVGLKLDCCNATGPSRDILLNRTKRYDPIIQMLTNTKLQSLTLVRCEGFWSRLSKMSHVSGGAAPSTLSSSPSSSSSSSSPSSSSSSSHSSSSAPAQNILPAFAFQLRTLTIQSAMDNWKHDQHRLAEILRQSPKLTELKLQVADSDAAFEVIKANTNGFQHLRLLNLSVIHSNQQEQVDVTFADDGSGEIAKVVISTNKRPYTQLAYSGKVVKLVMYHEFGMQQEGAQLRSVLEKNKSLRELGVRCHVSGFVALFDLVRCGLINHEDFKRCEIQDLAGWNKLYSTNLKDTLATRLELTSTDSTGRENIFAAYGWAIRTIPSGIQFTTSLASALDKCTTNPVGPSPMQSLSIPPILERLCLDITKLDPVCLNHLIAFVDRCERLYKFELVVRWNNSTLNTGVIAKAIARLAPRITHLRLCVYNLLPLLFDLATSMVPRYDGPRFVPGATMPLLKELEVVPTSVDSLPPAIVSSPSHRRQPSQQQQQQQQQQRQPQPPPPPQQQQQQQKSKIKHCQLNNPQIQWLIIPLASPVLKRVSLGYLDILKDDWTATLQAIHFGCLQHLTFQGTNMSDSQAKLLASLIPANAILKSLTIQGSLVSKACLSHVEGYIHDKLPSCKVVI
ncbi:hypothetical protein BGZ94_006052 [Podila epigama]|nr:hypothetical protein BGZ94_006052 [Podila epigama]